MLHSLNEGSLLDSYEQPLELSMYYVVWNVQ